MDEARARAYLDSGEGAAELDAELDEARRRGVRAVPTFVFDDQYVVSGAQPASTFLQVLEEVQRRALAAQPAGGSAEDDDGCADGACATGGEAA
jgi:predicted DsbA family dithiol-disulfide isomerase